MITSKDLLKYRKKLEEELADTLERHDKEVTLISAKIEVVDELVDEYGDPIEVDLQDGELS